MTQTYKQPTRCTWAVGEHLIPYHDVEWGVPVHDDRRHYEFLVLEGAQAGLSWVTVLRRREGYRTAFANFDPEKVASFSQGDVARLLGDSGIIRNRAKVESAITNARALLALRDSLGSFDTYLWDLVGGAPLINRWRSHTELPASTTISERLSKDLRTRGFRFVGPIVCYAHLQAAGLVNDHLVSCFRWSELGGAGGS
ncbi:MAG: DNA-3-methyladenine glycosylase I [Acidimicrobiales bacterium]